MNNDKLHNLRHSAAHLLAAAVMDLYPDAKRTIGPPIENGFYYDFDFVSPISEKDLVKIEQKMRGLVKKWNTFERHEVSVEEAKQENKDNPYKLELIEEFAKDGKTLSVYEVGSFRDLCRGGHVEHPSSELKHFKLLSIAGAYWRGDEKNKMLTRIYGTAFETKEDLDKYLWQLEEAKKRDHKKIGREQELFVIAQDIGSGFPLFLPKGALVRKNIEDYLMQLKKRNGFSFVWTPHIARSTVYHKSKHWGKYDAMFAPMDLDGEEYVLKPMNCPHHFEMYLSNPHSYKELPIIYAENGTVYRNEKKGELNGLFRVRAATQDDTHAFVMYDQIPSELERYIGIVKEIMETFGFHKYRLRISTRDKENPSKYLGKPEVWDKAEEALIQAAKNQNVEHYIGPGEAAFYGPKIDLMMEDAIGREWQCSTIQLDFQQPENFNLNYIDAEGKESRVAVIHIAMIGSIERFMGILIEHYAGVFPLWLSPVQVRVLPVSEKVTKEANAFHEALKKKGIRSELDQEQKSIGYKIRQATLQKVAYMVIIGEKEIEKKDNQYGSVRSRDGKDLGVLSVDEFNLKLQEAIEKFQ